MIDAADYLRFALALVFVLALIGLASWLMRRYGPGGRVLGGRSNGRRIGIVESAAIDGKRRLVLVRRDDAEHLLLIGGDADVVVESGIRPGPVRSASGTGPAEAGPP